MSCDGDALEGALARGDGVGQRPLWTEEPARRPRLPDPIRAAAVRAGIIASLTIVAVDVAVLAALARAWVAAPATLVAVVSTVAATWAVLDVWVTRQVYIQRHGVLSGPSSAARESRRARRARERQARRDARVGRPARDARDARDARGGREGREPQGPGDDGTGSGGRGRTEDAARSSGDRPDDRPRAGRPRPPKGSGQPQSTRLSGV